MTLEKAFIVSCNTIFAQVGIELGSKKLVEGGEKFGLNGEIPFELKVKKSKIPSSSEMDKVELAWTAVGQGRLLITPFEAALITSAIANDGKMMEPFIIKEIKDSEGKTIFTKKPKVYRKILPPETALEIKKVMVKAVEEGTGKRAKIKNFTIGGKTGTAEIEGKSPHAWFTCFAPAENPQIVVTVLIENGGVGGKIAAPLAKSILESFFKEY